ncbi:hypothetical protein A2U01_0061654, partial [Trifolium medium]|nr:hypothetical protein [Trifolium medium]
NKLVSLSTGSIKLFAMANGITTSSKFPANLPVFKGEHYDRWCTQMKVIFIFQEVLEILNAGVLELAAESTEA